MPIPLVSPEQMRRWEDATWKAGISEREVIARVGEALAGWIRCRLPARARLLVVAGKGHNGDDGRAAFEALGGREARLVEILDPAGGLEDLEQALLEEPDAIVDCLFGIGLDRPVEGGWRRAIEAINASAALRLSVDVPSGLHAGTGEALGAAVRADYTLAVAAAKTGTMAARAASHAGYVRILEDVGLVPWQGDHPVPLQLGERLRRRPSPGVPPSPTSTTSGTWRSSPEAPATTEPRSWRPGGRRGPGRGW